MDYEIVPIPLSEGPLREEEFLLAPEKKPGFFRLRYVALTETFRGAFRTDRSKATDRILNSGRWPSFKLMELKADINLLSVEAYNPSLARVLDRLGFRRARGTGK